MRTLTEQEQEKEDAASTILASVAVGFVRGNGGIQPTHYKQEAIGGPLLVRWPDGRWFAVSVTERKDEEEKEKNKAATA